MKLLALMLTVTMAATSQMKPIQKPTVDAVKCLVIDSVVVREAACASGSCSTGPGVVTGEEFKRALLGGVEITGHNSCSSKQPTRLSLNVWSVNLSFYDKNDFRIALANITVASLDPGEKFRHSYALPDDGTAAVSAKVKEVTTY